MNEKNFSRYQYLHYRSIKTFFARRTTSPMVKLHAFGASFSEILPQVSSHCITSSPELQLLLQIGIIRRSRYDGLR
jgi:hypothetical protein